MLVHVLVFSILPFNQVRGCSSWAYSFLLTNSYISCIAKSESQLFFKIILVWSTSLWLVVLTLADSAQISMSFCVEFPLEITVKYIFCRLLKSIFFSLTSQCVMFWPSTRPHQKNAIPRWCTGRKWHIPMASNRKRSRGRVKAYNMGQGEGPTVPIQTDAPEESDLWTAWQLFPLDDD